MGKEDRKLTICSAVGTCMGSKHEPWLFRYGTSHRLAPEEKPLVRQEMKTAVSLLHPGPAGRTCFPLVSVDMLPGELLPITELKATG